MSFICTECKGEISSPLDMMISEDGVLCRPCATITVEQAYERLEARFPGYAISIQYQPGHVAARIYDSNPPSCYIGDTPAGMLRDAGVI